MFTDIKKYRATMCLHLGVLESTGHGPGFTESKSTTKTLNGYLAKGWKVLSIYKHFSSKQNRTLLIADMGLPRLRRKKKKNVIRRNRA